MRKLIQGTLAVLAGVALAAGTVALLGDPAQAEPTNECKTWAEHLTNRPDTGTGGHVWALDTMTRTMRVCASDEVAPEGKRWYYAAVTDEGTFVTNEGKTPRGVDGLPAGVTGTVKGGFRAHFTADAKWVGWEPDELTNSTPTGEWVKTAFPSAEGTLIGSYVWTYKTACETYKDDNDVYTGDITKVCVAESPSPSPSTSTPASPPPTTTAPSDPPSTTAPPSDPPATTSAPSDPPVATTSAPPMAAAGNELPVTGPKVPNLVFWGLGAVIVGSLLGLFAAIRSRRDSTTFTA